jgi:hypothetical protein
MGERCGELHLKIIKNYIFKKILKSAFQSRMSAGLLTTNLL